MTAQERQEANHYIRRIEPALTVGTEAHAAFILLRAMLADVHGAADHAPKRRGRPAKVIDPAGVGQTT